MTESYCNPAPVPRTALPVRSRWQNTTRLILMLASLLISDGAASESLPVAMDLQADARTARAQHLPIVLFFHSRSCPFCREVEELYLLPMLKETEKKPRFLLRAVEINETRPLVAFDGTRTDSRAFATQQGVSLVPYLRFIGPDGKPLVPDLVGLASRDFYNAYLEESINTARDKLRSP